jgi:prolyl oligopeptidase
MTLANLSGQLQRLTLKSGQWQRERIALPDQGTILPALSDPSASSLFVSYQSFLQPPTLYEVDLKQARAKAIKQLPEQFDASQYVTEQLQARSADGTAIPYFLVRPKAFEAQGNAPTLMSGYGAFGMPELPEYSGTLGRLWLEQGGVYVLTNIRGGGEFGPSWHVVRTERRRTYEDFIAIAEDLIRRKITSPRRLGMQGLSAGGMLMGVMLTSRPDLFHAALVEVPVLDLLRDYQLSGATVLGEFGSPEVPEERAFLESISPYGKLQYREDFPVPFLLTSTTDAQAHPGHARKFAAKMQSLKMPYYYYESREGGHAIATTPEGRAQLQALRFTYLANRLIPM